MRHGFASSCCGAWDENDDRWLVDATRGLAYVADGSGSRYGGYHAPFAIEPALEAFVAAAAVAADAAGLRRAAEAAHVVAATLRSAYDAAFARRLEHESDRLDVARLAADDVRPPHWRRRPGTLASFGVSLTACTVVGTELAVVQVGACRAYLVREARAALLLPEHTVPGTSPPVVTSLLGYGEPAIDVVVHDVSAGDRVVLCTDGLWIGGDAAIARVVGARDAAALDAAVADVSARTREDATAVVIDL